MPEETQLPEKIGKYDITGKIGSGGFGAVYRGRDPYIKRTVAIKTCQLNDEEIKSRFFREAELAGNLHHRHITTIYDFGVENGIPFIVQEFLSGEDLDKKIKRGEALPLIRKVEILTAITDGLAYAHAAGIIHRDIKPANVRILDDGSVKIMDFGIAKSLQSESNLTQTGITLGTSAYLAPEQIRGEPVDRRTDIFSLGILAYELLTYRKPFRGEHLSTVLYKILNETPEPIETLVPDAPAALVAAVNRAMEKDRENRYATMEALRQDLQNIQRELAGSSSQFPTAVIPTDDMDATVMTPSSGIVPSSITPPSGSLARVPAVDATPSAASASSASGRSKAGLELVNFRDPSATDGEATVSGRAAELAALAAEPARASRTPIFIAIAAVAVAVVAVFFYLNRGKTSAPVPAPPPAAAKPEAAAPIEFPEPQVGADAKAPAPAGGSEAKAKPPAPAAAPAESSESNPSAPAAKRRVQFSSIPVATLSIDGKVIGPSIPAKTLELAEGTHKVRFEAEGLEPYQREFKVGPKETNRIAYQFPVGYIVISADPSWAGAAVIIGGKYKGSLPQAARLRMPKGTYSVTLHREGFQPVTQQITVPERGESPWTPPPAVAVDQGMGQ
ncbi:MAG TPA: serine/threonine-protein kinase [Thermoanaerobaculia bacterium]|nr:serine/threonine-protein kinase [Thermoanaerobaculia bacterium]